MKIEFDKGAIKVDGNAVGTIEITARKTQNFKGEESNIETTVMLGGQAIVINTSIEVAEAKAVAAQKPA